MKYELIYDDEDGSVNLCLGNSVIISIRVDSPISVATELSIWDDVEMGIFIRGHFLPKKNTISGLMVFGDKDKDYKFSIRSYYKNAVTLYYHRSGYNVQAICTLEIIENPMKVMVIDFMRTFVQEPYQCLIIGDRDMVYPIISQY